MINVYLSEVTWLHRLPAAFKLVFLAVLTALLLPNSSPLVLSLTTVSAAAVYASLGAPGLRRLTQLLKTAGLLAFILALFQFFLSFTQLGTQGAAVSAVVSALRLLSLVLVADQISITTPMSEVLLVIDRLLWPLRVIGVSTRPLSIAISLVTRIVMLLRDRHVVIAEAFAVRTSRKPRLRLMTPLIRQTGHSVHHLAEAFHSRQLRRQSANQETTGPDRMTSAQ